MRRINEHIYTWSDSRETNLGLVVTEEGAIVIDTPFFPADAQQWHEQVVRVGGEPLYVINTDHHLGHCLGNCRFTAPVVAHHFAANYVTQKYDDVFHTRLVDSFRERQPHVAAGLRRTKFVVPEVGVMDRLTLHKGGVEVELIHVGGHTPATVMVHIPVAGVLFSGDILVVERHPYLGDANSEEWLQALELVREIGAEKVVPGHGRLIEGRDIDRLRDYIVEMREAVQGHFDAGLTRKETVTRVKMLDRFPVAKEERVRVEKRVKASVQRLYDEFKAQARK
ncbi:MAG: MBL fold metallo-hydrolase [Anaerolineae bacterium]